MVQFGLNKVRNSQDGCLYIKLCNFYKNLPSKLAQSPDRKTCHSFQCPFGGERGVIILTNKNAANERGVMSDTINTSGFLSKAAEEILVAQIERQKRARREISRVRDPLRKAILRAQIAQGERARSMLITMLSRMAARIARKFEGIYGTPFEDLYQSAMEEVTRSLRNYDPYRGARLTSFLWQPVHRAAARELCSSGQGLRRSIRYVERRRKENNFLGREGSESDQGLTEAKETVLSGSVTVDTIVYLGDEEEQEHLIYTEPETDRWELHDFMLQVVSSLPVRERLVISWLYGLGNECLSVSEVAERMRVSPGEVRRIKRRALNTLKKVITDEKSGWIE